MSTKIYNAYSCKQLNTQELNDFIQNLRKQCYLRLREQMYEQTHRKITRLIDLNAIYQTKPELSKLLYDHIELKLLSMYEEATEPPIRFTRKPDKTPITQQQQLKRIAKSPLSIRTLCKESVEHKYRLSKISNDYYFYDAHNSIVLFPKDENTLLFQTFGKHINQFMNEIMEGKHEQFQAQYDIKDYHYQNQTDQPEDISDETWQERSDTWDKVMPSGIPSKDGITIILTEIDNYYALEKAPTDAMLQQLEKIRDKNARIHRMAVELTDVTFLIDNKDGFSVTNSIQETRDQLIKEKGERYDKYLEYKNILAGILTDITNDDIKQPISNLFDMKRYLTN